MEMIFEYGKKESAYLRKKDEALGAYMKKRGFVGRKVEAEPFQALTRQIIAQQINGKAAEAVYNRVQALCRNEISERAIISLEIEELRSCGVSERKARNLQGLARYFSEKNITGSYFLQKSDEEIIAELTDLSGIGVWTAEMFLLFSLQRKNILSYGDYGIKKGLCLLHDLGQMDKKTFMAFKERYSPYASIASLYLWEIANENQK